MQFVQVYKYTFGPSESSESRIACNERKQKKNNSRQTRRFTLYCWKKVTDRQMHGRFRKRSDFAGIRGAARFDKKKSISLSLYKRRDKAEIANRFPPSDVCVLFEEFVLYVD